MMGTGTDARVERDLPCDLRRARDLHADATRQAHVQDAALWASRGSAAVEGAVLPAGDLHHFAVPAASAVLLRPPWRTAVAAVASRVVAVASWRLGRPHTS